MTDASKNRDALLAAVQDYFDLMYEADVTKFDRVFLETAQLHGLRDGSITMWSAAAYRGILARSSPIWKAKKSAASNG